MTNPVSGGFQFTPATGLNDTATYPSTPVSEAAARQQFMDMYWQLMNEMNSPTLSAAAFAQYNKLINGNFDLWKRGTSSTYTTLQSLVYLDADRWRVYFSGDFGVTITQSRQPIAGAIPNSSYFNRISSSGAGTALSSSSAHIYDYLLENGTRYLCGLGKKLTLSFWARSTIANKKIVFAPEQRYGTGGSPSSPDPLVPTVITLSTTWAKYTVTFSTATLTGKTFGANNDDLLFLRFFLVWGSSYNYGGATENYNSAGDVEITQFQLNTGDIALPFQPQTIDEESKKALRYTWIPQTNSVFVRASTFTANTLVFDVPLPVQLRTTPTIRGTVNTDIIAYTVAGVVQTGFTASAVLTSNGVRVTMTKAAHGLTDAYLEIKTTSGFDAEL